MTLRIAITAKDGQIRRLSFDSHDITVGRAEDSDVCLPRSSVSKKHVRIAVEDGKVFVLDLKSRNGTFLNGRRLLVPQTVSAADEISIGDFVLGVEQARGNDSQHTVAAPPPVPGASPPDAAQEHARIQRVVHDKLIEAMDLRRLDLDALGSGELWKRTEATTRQIVARMEQSGALPVVVDREELIGDVLHEALGLGPLELYLADESVSEIMVNAPDELYVERKGKLEKAAKAFSSAKAVLGVIERIVAPLGRHIDESSPLVDARLPDGSRVNAIIPPLALKGPAITIRKFKRDLLTAEHLAGFGALTRPMAAFLDACVNARRNVVISGV